MSTKMNISIAKYGTLAATLTPLPYSSTNTYLEITIHHFNRQYSKKSLTETTNIIDKNYFGSETTANHKTPLLSKKTYQQTMAYISS